LSLISAPNDPIDFFGLFEIPDDWSLTAFIKATSGSPYTPYVPFATYAEEQRLYNSATGPNQYYLDLKFSKGFNVFGTKLTLMIDIFNVFDAVNVNYTTAGFNPIEGRPWKYGDTDKDEQDYILPYYSMVYQMQPFVYSNPRYAKVGVKWEF
jgi:hypothetical protein